MLWFYIQGPRGQRVSVGPCLAEALQLIEDCRRRVRHRSIRLACEVVKAE